MIFLDILGGAFAALAVIACIASAIIGLIALYEYFADMDEKSRKAEVRFIIYALTGSAAAVMLLAILFFKVAGGR